MSKCSLENGMRLDKRFTMGFQGSTLALNFSDFLPVWIFDRETLCLKHWFCTLILWHVWDQALRGEPEKERRLRLITGNCGPWIMKKHFPWRFDLGKNKAESSILGHDRRVNWFNLMISLFQSHKFSESLTQDDTSRGYTELKNLEVVIYSVKGKKSGRT